MYVKYVCLAFFIVYTAILSCFFHLFFLPYCLLIFTSAEEDVSSLLSVGWLAGLLLHYWMDFSQTWLEDWE